ncbi:MAG TPA: PD-(D/E)XK nuclease family protein [Dehalococcoidia bacterium]|nr:PD-(D/E)XK nuclease family protein [Dehalococcoidia bacterium]
MTVIVPSRLAALQLRRRLAAHGPYAGVRFEVVSRVAELIAAADLARAGIRPLARPIGDYAAALVARESKGALSAVAELPGYARALRHTFLRLRRAGFKTAADIPYVSEGGRLDEVARLYGRFREMTAAFYDAEDLLEAAAARLRAAPERVLPELGRVYVLPPARRSAAEADFLDAVRGVAPAYEEVAEPAGRAEQRFILAPDATTEASLVAREVLKALEGGARLDQVAVFYGGDRAYRALLQQTFEAAGIPTASMPGMPLDETAAGRAVLALARLPIADYRREAVFEFLSLAPLRGSLPSAGGQAAPRVSQWRRIAREAGAGRGLEHWQESLLLFRRECEDALAPEADVSEGRRRLAEADIEGALNLGEVVAALGARLEPLRRRQPARDFIPAFLAVLQDYLAPDAEGFAELQEEVRQLGTIDALGGEFDLASFSQALEANLAAASIRRGRFGQGVLITDYRLAAGLSFSFVFICGAFEGAFPAAAETEPLVQDETWARLRQTHPFADDLSRRLALAREAAARLRSAASGGTLTWSCPLQAADGTRDYYPSSPMVEAARERDAGIVSAGGLRRAGPRDWLVRPASPLAAAMVGPPVNRWEVRLREAVIARRAGALPPAGELERPVMLLRSRRGSSFTEFDGNLAGLSGLVGPALSVTLSPTILEYYGACGFRYFLASVLRLKGVEEPEEGETMGAAERGLLVHRALERFFRREQERGRPRPYERWTRSDLDALLAVFDEEYERLRGLGRAGLDVYADFERGSLRADLAAFLEHDNEFRAETGAVPAAFEQRLQPTRAGEALLSGIVDRLDMTPDGRRAWVIDYKTGSASEFEKLSDADPFAGGTKLQLPVYALAAGSAEEVRALYWFVSRRGEFKRVHYLDSEANRQRFERTLGAILDGVRAGAFPAVPGDEEDFRVGASQRAGFSNCRFCDFDRICSRRRVYEFQAKAGDAALDPWRRVARVARDEAGP